jgi:hypothetical protein
MQIAAAGKVEILSPWVCGTANRNSTRAAICLTEEGQWTKLKLAVDDANEVWGSEARHARGRNAKRGFSLAVLGNHVLAALK